jgi:hypothetical protein
MTFTCYDGQRVARLVVVIGCVVANYNHFCYDPCVMTLTCYDGQRVAKMVVVIGCVVALTTAIFAMTRAS